MESVPILGYWDIRGLAQPIRYLLKYAGVQFIDKRYEFGEVPRDYDRTNAKDSAKVGIHWKKDKPNLGLDFPNLPYYIDKDIKVSYMTEIYKLN